MCRGIVFLIWLLASCSSKTKSLRIKGSDTEVNLTVNLAEAYHYRNSNMIVSVSGGGSGLGISSLINGNTDIANSSREINQKETEIFNKRGIAVSAFIFAQDAIAFVVSSDLPIDSISIHSLSKIMNGEWNDWKYLTGKSMPVNIYGRQNNSGTYDYIKQSLGIQFSPYAKQMNGNAQILEAIKTDRSGIGYVGSGYLKGIHEGQLKVLSIYSPQHYMAVSPLDTEKVASGLYFFRRPLYQYYRTPDSIKVKPFFEFEKSNEGLAIIQASGYFPPKTEP